MIIYFTGTGNSLFLANRLAEALNEKTADAVCYISNGSSPVFHSETPYIFVCPTYAWRVPHIFEEWIRKCTFKGNRKAYYVLNCGSDIGAAEKYAKKLSEDMHFTHMGMAEIVMPENYIAVFSAPDEKETAEILNKARTAVDFLAEKIKKQEPFETVGINTLGHLCSGIVNGVFYKLIVGAKKFYATNECISCGKCVENCMLHNIYLKDGKPVWGQECTHCMACICKCPVEAIEYGKHTEGLRRYVCPEK